VGDRRRPRRGIRRAGRVASWHTGGQSAVGDSFAWLTDRLLANGASSLADLSSQASALAPGEHGLVALDWFNGNRSVLVDQRLSGLIVGLTLHTEAHHVLRALVEATAFGARRIVEAIEASGTEISTVVAAGGLPTHSPWIVQVYADAMGRPIKVAASAQGSARGAAMCAAVAAGRFADVESAQAALVRYREPTTEPRPNAAAIYERIYAGYLALHDAFAAGGVLGGVMKSALAIRDSAAAPSSATAIGVR
jgi:L-ribulokinase